MGYTTDFFGSLKLSRPATQQETEYINKLSDTRRMKRDVEKLFELYDGKHGNPFAKTREEIYGVDGEYFVGDRENASVIDHNCPPGQDDWLTGSHQDAGQPGLWCNWILTDDGTELKWNGSEKFCSYVEWLEYLIKHFFEPWGIELNGEIEWQGEDRYDIGKIVVDDNEVEVKEGSITY
jgi:hypothetical protein